MAEFIKKRTAIGKVMTDSELIRRLSHELQIPNKYGKRILNAYRAVIKDAVTSGEGFNLGVGLFRIVEHKNRYYPQGLFMGQKRQFMYKYDVKENPIGKEVLRELTRKNFTDIEQKVDDGISQD